MWRQSFDIPESHYTQKLVRLDEIKIRDRMFNSFDRIKRMRKYVDFNSVCDIGSGEGIFLKALKEKGYKDGIGIEPSNQASGFAKENSLDVRYGTLNNLREILTEDTVHTFTLFHVIEHLDNPIDSIKKIFDVMKQGDRLLIETPNIDSYILERLNYKHDLIYTEHLFYFTPVSLQKLLEEVGFTSVASGKRDFVSYTQSIRELLFKIGMGDDESKFNQVNHSMSQENNNIEPVKENGIKRFLKNVLRSLLRKIIHLLGREDYIWIVVEK